MSALAMTAILGTVLLMVTQAYPPFTRPTLSLTTASLIPGDNLGFIQAATEPRRCRQENVRVMWRWEDATHVRRVAVPLSDVNPIPRIWPGATVVAVPIPANTSPGEWFYFRETQSWCSLWNYIVGPSVERTMDVPFTVLEHKR